METDKLKTLLVKYYSGDITPDEYHQLLSLLKDAGELTPELEAERSMLLAIESCEPEEPEGLEDRLIMTIDFRSKRRQNFFRMVFSGSVAAIVLMIVAIGIHFHYNNTFNQLRTTANVSVTHETIVRQETQKSFETEASVCTIQIAAVAQKDSTLHSISDEELKKSAQVADEALMEVLANVKIAKNDVIETIADIEIIQTTVYNIF